MNTEEKSEFAGELCNRSPKQNRERVDLVSEQVSVEEKKKRGFGGAGIELAVRFECYGGVRR